MAHPPKTRLTTVHHRPDNRLPRILLPTATTGTIVHINIVNRRNTAEHVAAHPTTATKQS